MMRVPAGGNVAVVGAEPQRQGPKSLRKDFVKFLA